uniref:Uncharacterized protein n=1 Tax=Anguilla anguilla TaxID=7936 RepID=A0A0E9P8Z4_ANGAN
MYIACVSLFNEVTYRVAILCHVTHSKVSY